MNLINYHELPSFTNIYSLSLFDNSTKRGMIISTSQQIYRCYVKENGSIKFVNIKLTKSLSIFYLGEIEILGQTSIHAKNFLYISYCYRHPKGNSDVYSLTVMKFLGDDLGTYEKPANIELPFVPFKIFMVKITKRLIEEQVILFVANTLEIIKNSKLINNDFQFHPSAVVSAQTAWHIKYFIVAMGLQNGEICVFKYKNDFVFENVTKIIVDGPISSVLLVEIETEVIDLLVVSAAGYCILYRDVSQDFENRKIIIQPHDDEALTCAVASDVDFDGQKEIIVGSFGEKIYCYKVEGEGVVLLWELRFMHPVLALGEIDINKDGINEIVVVTMNGISVLVPDYKIAFEKLRAVKEYLLVHKT